MLRYIPNPALSQSLPYVVQVFEKFAASEWDLRILNGFLTADQLLSEPTRVPCCDYPPTHAPVYDPSSIAADCQCAFSFVLLDALLPIATAISRSLQKALKFVFAAFLHLQACCIEFCLCMRTHSCPVMS